MKNHLTKIVLLFAVLFASTHVAIGQCQADAGPNITMCVGESEILGDSPSATGNSPFTYSWSPAAGLSCTNCPNPVCTATVSTVYTLTITDDNGCTDSDNVNVTVAPNPVAGFTFAPNNGCSNVPIQFTSTSTGAGLNYSWNFDDPGPGNNSSQVNPQHEFDASGSGSQSYDVRLIVTNSAGCKDTIFQTVTVAQSPGPALMDPLTSFKNCDGSNFNMTVYDISDAPGTNYTIIWGDGSPNYTASTFPGAGVTHLYSTSDIFDLYYVVTGTNGCTDTTHQLVSNITNPAIGAANPGATTGCGPVTLCFPLSNYAANHPSTFYTVNYGDGSPIDTLPHPPPAVICHTYSQTSCGLPGNAFTFIIKAINSCDSSLASISPIRVYTGPTADFTPSPPTQCVGSAVTFLNQSTLGYNSTCSTSTLFTWNFGDGVTQTGVTLTNPTHIYSAPGTYTVSLSTQNACGTTTHTETVCIEAPPVPNFTVTPDTACIPFTAQVTNLSSVLNTCNVTYMWSVLFNGSTCVPSSGTWSFINGTTASSFEPELQFSSAGQYTVRLTMTNSCGSFIYDQIVIAQAPPLLTMSALPTICAGEAVSPAVTVNNCYEPVDLYTWSFVGGSPNTSNLPVPGSVSYASAGNYTVTVQVSNLCGTTSASTPLVVVAPPVANAGTDLEFCSGGSESLGATPVGGVSYSWTPSTGLNSAVVANPTVTLTNVTANPQVNQYVLTASTSATCLSRDTVLVTVNPLPILTVNSPTICFGQSAPLLVSGAGSGGNYTWNSSPSLSCTACDNPTANPSTTTVYAVTGTNSYNCQSSVNSIVTVNTLPIVNAGPDQLLCDQPLPVLLSGSPVGGTWTGSANVAPDGTFTPNGTEVATLYYNFTNSATGCSNLDSMIVTVNPAVIPSVDPLDSMCVNQGIVGLTTQLNATPLGGTFTGTGVVGSNFNPGLAGLGTFEIVYNYGSGSCASSDTAYIRVDPQPILNVNSGVICAGDSLQLLISGADNYSWSPATSLSCSTCPDPFAFPSVSTTYSIIGTNTFGCSTTVTTPVTVNALPIVSAGPDLVLCDQPIAENLNGTPVGGVWTGSPNVTSGGVFTPNGAEVSTLYYTFTNGTTGCTNVDSMVVTVSPAVTPTLDPSHSVCFNDPVVNLTTLFNASPLGGSWTGNGVSDPNLNPAGAGVGTHTLTYTYGSGTCQTFATTQITVNPQPVINVNNSTICATDTASLIASGAGVGGTYSWTNGTSLSCTNCFDPLAFPVTTTSYTVTGTTALGCSNNAISTVTVNPLPVANAGNDTTICNIPVPVQFNGTQAGGVWSGPNIDASGLFTPAGSGSFTATYTVTLGTGCVNADSMIIQVVEPAVADAGPDEEICIGSANVNLPLNPAGGTWTGTNVTATGVFSPITAGTYDLVYSYGAGNCLTRDTMTFVVHPLPTVTAGADAEFCATDPQVNFTGSPLGGNWSGTGIIDGVLGTFDPVVAGVGVHLIVYTYSDPITTCLNRDTLIADVHPLPVVDFGYNPIVCLGNSESFTNTSTLVITSAWDFGDGAFSVVNSPSHAFNATGFFDVQLVVTTVFGCQDSITHTVEVREPPVADFTVLPDSACGPMNVAFTNNSSGISVTYAWDFGNGITSTLEDPANVIYNAGILADTSYTITLQVTNFCGTVTDTEDIIVMPTPTAIFGSDFNSGCSPWTANFASTSLGLPDSYYWDFGNGVTSATTDSLFSQIFTTGTTPTDYTIMLVVQNECGQDTAYHTVTVNPNTVTAFFNTSATTSCNNLTVDFTQYTLGGTLWSWDFGDGTSSSAYSPTHTYPAPGVYDVSLFVNDGCSFDTNTVSITVNAPPTVGFTYSPDSNCVNVPFSFTTNAVGSVSSFWDFGDGTTSNLSDPLHAYTTSGTFTVTLTATDLINGCTATLTQDVLVSVNPVAQFTPDPINGCVPLTVLMDNQSTGATFYYWDFGNGNTSAASDPTHTFTSPGVYTVQLIAENVNGCTDTVTQNITVHALPVADFSATYNCTDPVSVQFSNMTTGAVGYTWDFGDGQTSTLNNPNHSYDSPGTYIVTLTTVNQYGCEDETQQTVTIYPVPELSFVAPSVICSGEEYTIVPNAVGLDSIVWNMGDGTILTSDIVTYSYPNVGVYTVTAIGYGGAGCTVSTVSPVSTTIHPSAVADFSYDNVEINGLTDGTVQYTNNSVFANSYLWLFGDGDSSDVVDPVHEFLTANDYYTTLIAMNQFGCNDTVSIQVDIDFFNGLFLPNAIYPGHESFEVSHFVPKGVGLKEFELLIYDDWGNLIWRTTALDAEGRPTESWDGTFNGEPVQQDAYVWKVTATFIDDSAWEGKEYKKGKFKQAGTVTVIR